MNTLSLQHFKAMRMHLGDELKPVRWLLARLYLPISALLIISAIAVVQLLLVGGFDRLGASPQFSFLTLNLLLIGVFTTVSLYPFSLRARRAQQASLFGGTATATERTNVTATRAIVCKLLIIRRVSSQDGVSTSNIFNQRSVDDQIVAQN